MNGYSIIDLPHRQAPPTDIGENTKNAPSLWNAVDLHLTSVLARDSQQPFNEDLRLHPCGNLVPAF